MKYTRILLFFLFVMLWSSGCEKSNNVDIVEKIAGNAHKTEKINEVTTEPVQHATMLLNINPKNMARPNSIEEGYHMVGRMPVIDHVKKSPFVLQNWASEKSDKIQRSSQNSIEETILCLLNTVNGRVYKNKDVGSFQHCKTNLLGAYEYLCQLYNEEFNLSSERIIRDSPLSNRFKNKLSDLVLAFADASILSQRAFSGLSKEELTFISIRPERYFFPNNLLFDFMTGTTEVQYKILTISRKIDFDKLFKASILMSRAIDNFSEYLKSNEESFFEHNINKEDINVPLFLPSPVGDIVVLGSENNQFESSAAILIDLGGNDKYLGQVSSGNLTPGRISISIDRDGDDIYDTQNDRYGQGFGCLSIGILADLSGNDIYIAGDMAQGVGIYGVGLLVDYEGNDYYRMNILGQGVGLFGIGGLIDKAGNDRYLINSLGQGVGSTMGIGLLCDREGNDKYIAKREETRGQLLANEQWSHVQGSGLSIRSHKWRRNPSIYGGIGILSDGEGDDFYYAEKGNCMGSSYFMSIGVLVDHAGDDKYIPQNGYGISSAVHWTASAFIDKAGNDNYFGATQTGGVASDRSVAIMADYEGNDVYGPTPEYLRNLIKKEHADEKKTLDDTSIDLLIDEKLADVSYGSAKKPNAIGVLIDYQGDDRYYARNSGWGESCGGVMPPLEPRHWGHGLLLDLNGNDYYSKSGRKNNHYYLYYNHGICYDTEYSGQQFVGKETKDYDSFIENESPSAEYEKGTNPIGSKLLELKDYSIFKRFSEYGRLIDSGDDAINDIIIYLLNSNDIEINRGLTEVLVELVLKREMSPSLAHKIESLINAKDPYVRIFSTRILGWWDSSRSIGAILNALKHADAMDRSHLIWALGKVDQNRDSTGIVADYALNDPIHQNRLEALLVLTKYAKKNISLKKDESNRVLETLLKLIADNDIIISAYAAKGLEFYGDNTTVRDALKRKMTSNDEYVKRFSAQSLIRNGVIEAIPVLIQTLTFPSIDTYKHYDHEIAKDLAFYCGVDFPEEIRYEYQTWHDWWKNNGPAVDLKKNLKIMHDIERASNSENVKEGIEIFENLLLAYPENLVIRKRYLYFCNHWVTYNFLTQPEKTREIIVQCIQLQKTMIRLDPGNREYKEGLVLFEKWLAKL